jgi:hypothetical protein
VDNKIYKFQLKLSHDNIIQYFYYTIFLSYSIDELVRPLLYHNPGSAPVAMHAKEKEVTGVGGDAEKLGKLGKFPVRKENLAEGSRQHVGWETKTQLNAGNASSSQEVDASMVRPEEAESLTVVNLAMDDEASGTAMQVNSVNTVALEDHF